MRPVDAHEAQAQIYAGLGILTPTSVSILGDAPKACYARLYVRFLAMCFTINSAAFLVYCGYQAHSDELGSFTYNLITKAEGGFGMITLRGHP